MDPISVSLSVVTFATAVKDIVELGQKIHESFAKVPRNYQKARTVAGDIKEMVDEIEEFFQDHNEELNKMKDFHTALLGLVAKFKNFEESIIPLLPLPQAGGRRRDRFTRAWVAWRDNNKIEEAILDLQSNIVKVMRRYMMKNAMRTGLVVEKIHQETSQGLTGISQGLEVLEGVRRDLSLIRITTAANPATHGLSGFSTSPSTDIDRQIIMFAQSTSSASTPMLRTPDVITEELMTSAYIKLQVNHIVVALDGVSALPIPTPNDVDDFRMYPSMEISMQITDLCRFVIRQVLDIRDLLDKGNIQSISIQKGARVLNNLSLGLGALQMSAESIQVGAWSIKLGHMLVDSSPEDPNLCAALSVYLTNQAVRYYDNGDKIQSLQAIQKAHKITLDLRTQCDGEVRVQILYSHVLLHYSPLVDTQRSIEMLAEVVQVLEDIFDIQELTQSQTPVRLKEILQSSSSLDHLFSSPLPVIAISNYALALQRLGACLFAAGRGENAIDLQLLAIAVRRKMVSLHGDEYRVTLAKALSSLVQNQIAKNHIPAETLLSLTDECIKLFRELTGYNPIFHLPSLILTLWAKAPTLEGLGRDTEAIATLEEVISLVGELLDYSAFRVTVLDRLGNWFRRLKRHDDAVRTNRMAIAAYRLGPEHQAVRYGALSKDLRELQRYKESAEAARKSIELHQRMAMADPGTQVAALVFMFSELAHCWAASGDYSESLIAWRESLSRLDNFLLANPDASRTVSNDYLFAALHTYTSTSYVLEDEEEILKVSSTAAQYLRQLLEDSHATEILLWAEFTHAYNLLRVGRLQDAQQYIEDWVNLWGDKLEDISNSDMTRWHATMIGLKSNILDSQGYTEGAILANQRVDDIVKPSIDTHHPCFVEMIKAKLRNVLLQVDLGNGEDSLKALELAEEALQLARDDRLGSTVPTPVRSLHGVASIALSCREYERAFEIALEGCKICTTPIWQEESEGEFTILFRPSFLAILSSAEANLGRLSTAVVYAKKAVEVSLDIRDIRLHISTTTAAQSYIETRGNLAEILLATGDFAQARQICEERWTYFSKRVDTRRGEYRDLAPILRMLGILCCSEGRHDEGDNAAQELLRIMNTLKSAFPSLREQVSTRLRRQAEVPILKALNDMAQELECEHQTKVASLFAT